MTDEAFQHPNLSEHYGPAFDIGNLAHQLNDAGDHIQLAAALYEATALPPIELRRLMRGLARRESGASFESRRELAVRRLRALLRLNVEDARVVARSFDDAFIDLPAEWRERSREVEFAVIQNALHLSEFVSLTSVLPWLRDVEAARGLLAHLSESTETDEARLHQTPLTALIPR